MFKIILDFIVAFPELVRLFVNIQKQINEANIKHKVKQDIININKAFEDKDADALNRIFNRGQ